MPNEQNLIPNSERTPSELREMTSKGGKASGKSRRKKKSMKKMLETILDMPTRVDDDWELLGAEGISIDDFSGEDITNLTIIIVALIRQAKQGNVKAIKEIREIIGENPTFDHKKKMDKEELALKREKLKLEQKKLEDDSW